MVEMHYKYESITLKKGSNELGGSHGKQEEQNCSGIISIFLRGSGNT